MNSEEEEEEATRRYGRIIGYSNRGPLFNRPARPPRGVAVSNIGDLYEARLSMARQREKLAKKPRKPKN